MAAKPLPDAAYLRECFDYDPATGVLIWKRRPREHFVDDRAWRSWSTRYAGTVVDYVDSKGYIQTVVNYVHCRAHRLIWKMQTGDDPPSGIDHRDTVKTNNQWHNLRLATDSQNQSNRRNKPRACGLPKGVRQQRNRYTARCWVNGRCYHLGNFATPELAHEAYCAFGKSAHGEFFNPGTPQHRAAP